MSYLDRKGSFATSGGIQELSSDEMDCVGGGLAPVAVYLGGLAVGFALAALADYLDGGFND